MELNQAVVFVKGLIYQMVVLQKYSVQILQNRYRETEKRLLKCALYAIRHPKAISAKDESPKSLTSDRPNFNFLARLFSLEIETNMYKNLS